MPRASLSFPQSRFGAMVHGAPMRYAFAWRKLSGTCHSKYTRAVSEPAAAPTWLPDNMLPLIGAPLVHFGQVPAGLLVVWFANQTVWKLPSNRVSTTSTPGPQGTAPQRVCWKSEIGRASCRERVYISVVAVSLKKKQTNTPLSFPAYSMVFFFGFCRTVRTK